MTAPAARTPIQIGPGMDEAARIAAFEDLAKDCALSRSYGSMSPVTALAVAWAWKAMADRNPRADKAAAMRLLYAIAVDGLDQERSIRLPAGRPSCHEEYAEAIRRSAAEGIRSRIVRIRICRAAAGALDALDPGSPGKEKGDMIRP